MNSTSSECYFNKFGMAVKGFNITFGTSATLLNSILLLVLYADPFKKFRTPGTILVANLAIADGLTGLFALLRMLFSITGCPRHMNMLIYYSTMCTMQCSLFTVLLITAERFFAVAFPIRFKLHVTKLRVFFLSLLAWAISILLLELSVIFRDASAKISFLVFGTLNLLIIFSVIAGYCAIYKTLKRKEMEMGRYVEPCGTPRSGSVKRKGIKLTEHKRLVNTFLVITIILSISVLPMIILTAIASMCSEECKFRALQAYFVMEPLLLINFNVNPLVYAFQLPTYRQAFLTVFKCRKHSREIHPEHSEEH